MADEFNPQGVDQTPRNNENPNSTADTGNAEPKNPFVGGDSVDAGNASDSSEQQAPASSAALAADQQPTQAATEPIPDYYASAKGESTVVSSSPGLAAPAADQTSATTPLYRPPAPEYGAGGRPRLRHRASRAARPAAMPSPRSNSRSVSLHRTPQGQQGNRNPYYTNNPQPQGNGNPFNPPTQPQQNNGNPSASPVRMARMASSPSRAVCSVSAFPVPVRRTVKVRPSRDSPVSPAPPAGHVQDGEQHPHRRGRRRSGCGPLPGPRLRRPHQYRPPCRPAIRCPTSARISPAPGPPPPRAAKP